MKINSLKNQKHWYLIHNWSDKAFKGTVVNRALVSLHCHICKVGGSLEITLTISFSRRNVPGFAIGGLSGGEEKDVFWRIVKVNKLFLAKISVNFSRETQGCHCPFLVCINVRVTVEVQIKFLILDIMVEYNFLRFFWHWLWTCGSTGQSKM